jgi:hypothetical protein
MTPVTKLQIPTWDNTYITFDTINFTFDGACLVNGGATQINSPTHKPAYTESGIVRF